MPIATHSGASASPEFVHQKPMRRSSTDRLGGAELAMISRVQNSRPLKSREWSSDERTRVRGGRPYGDSHRIMAQSGAPMTCGRIGRRFLHYQGLASARRNEADEAPP